eukprot:GHVR01185444.1.p1 GENE.GHVR01185444.1~~GHVR01185444.1.p1  ORF type:complete len:609 (+),score=115.95 GHVR01185444.1:67-1893(+)
MYPNYPPHGNTQYPYPIQSQRIAPPPVQARSLPMRSPVILKSPSEAIAYALKASHPVAVVGPIIGKVTDTTARIVIEMNCQCTVKCEVRSTTQDPAAVSERSFKRRRPAAFMITGLKPSTRYTVHLSAETPILDKSWFRTFPSYWDISKQIPNIVVLSCDNVYVTRTQINPECDLWSNLADRISNGGGVSRCEGSIDMVIHMGDNVYLDNDLYVIEEDKKVYNGSPDDRCGFLEARMELDNLPKQYWDSKAEAICEIFRSVYRDTFNHPPTKQVLATVCNLMILDDHDIRDDFGDRETDRDPTHEDYFIACCAYEVYCEYQLNLLEDYESEEIYNGIFNVTRSYHHHVYGDIGILFVDLRGCKSFHHVPNDTLPHMGTPQWHDIDDALSDGGIFSMCRMLIAVSPIPVAYIANKLTMLFAKKVDDLYGSWGATPHMPETERFLDALFNWRGRKAGYREVCLVAGDVHQGGYSDIYDERYNDSKDEGLYILKQFTSSAIANKLPKWYESIALKMGRNMAEQLGDHHSYQHFKWINERNYGILRCWLERAELKDDDGNYFYGAIDPNMFNTRFDCMHVSSNNSRVTEGEEVTSTYKAFNCMTGWCCGACN